MTNGDNGWALWAMQFIASCFGVGAVLGLGVGVVLETMQHRRPS